MIPSPTHFETQTQELIASELSRRRIPVMNLTDTQIYYATRGKNTEFFTMNYFDSVGYANGLVINNKIYVRSLLESSKVSIPKGRFFSFDNEYGAFDYVKKIKVPVFIRLPDSTKTFQSVLVKNLDDFHQAFQTFSKISDTVLIEEFQQKKELLRILYFANDFFQVLRIRSPYLLGDGVSNISNLFLAENVSRIRDNRQYLQPISINEQILEDMRLNKNIVLKKNQKLIFKQIITPEKGAYFEDVTSLTHNGFNNLGRKVLAAFPQSSHISFFVRTDAFQAFPKKESFAVTDVYSTFGPHIYFPLRRKRELRTFESVYVDLLFPEMVLP